MTSPAARLPVVLSAIEVNKNPGPYQGKRITVGGVVTQAVKGMGGVDFYILDGILRCNFRKGLHCTEGAHSETRRRVRITGTAVGRHGVTAGGDLVDCECPVPF
jgi:hypothetical protein